MRDRVEAYVSELRDIHTSRAAVSETSYYPALAKLFDAAGAHVKPKVRCVMQLRNIGAGMPDDGRQLFPELEMSALGGCRPCGNSMRKAYLSRASIRIVEPGAVLLFYRSEDWRAVDVIGVVEDSLASVDPDEIARFVGKSTVFDYDSIKRLCEEGEILALRFRQVLVLGSAARLSFSALRKNGVIKDAPISIQNISGGEPWLSRMTGLLY